MQSTPQQLCILRQQYWPISHHYERTGLNIQCRSPPPVQKPVKTTATMIKYTIDTINTVLTPLQPPPGHPTFGGLWQFNHHLAECLKILKHPQYTTYGRAGYIIQEKAYTLLSTKSWTDPEDTRMFTLSQRMQSRAPVKTPERERVGLQEGHVGLPTQCRNMPPHTFWTMR